MHTFIFNVQAREGTFPQEKEREERIGQLICGCKCFEGKAWCHKAAGAPSKGSLPNPKVFNFWLHLHAFLFWSVPSAKLPFHNKFLGIMQLPTSFNTTYKSD